MQFLQLHEPGETPIPHADEATPAVGIDLGTTHSVVAFSEHGKVEVLRNTHGHALIPSVVEYVGDKPVVGHPAREARSKGSSTAIASIKRRMGQAGERLEIAGKSLSPVEISADILREMRAIAERALGREVRDAVITVPAYFDDAARTATRDAGRLAGLNVLRLVAEPTAAALAYGLDKNAEGIYAIYDLGGGTFDISLLKLEQRVFQVLATGGDTQLGGDDFDALVATRRGGSGGAALSAARALKETLSEKESAEGFTRAEFEALIAPLVERTLGICKQALFDARLEPRDISGVVLVGGSTRVPLVRKKVEALFGKPPLSDINPDEVVAYGAALQAEALTHGSSNLLLDVVPLSLGLETMGGLVEKLIPRNTPIPVAVSQEFTTFQDAQAGMQFHITQGEREMAVQNRSLAKFELSGIPALPAGIARVKVTFAVDADGLLSVTAQEKTTGAQQRVDVKPSYGLPPEEIERMLLESMKHAREDISERLLAEAKVEAERNIAELHSAMKADGDLLSEAERKLIDSQTAYLREAIREGDRDRIDVEAQQLGRVTQAFAEKRMDRAIQAALKGSHVDSL